MTTECRSKLYFATLLSVLLAAVIAISGCANPEKAKIAHVQKGEAYLKDEKFQEAALEFRNAIQIDESLASAHWGLARSYEGLQRFQEAFEELGKTTELDANNLDARVKLGNYYIAAAKGHPEMILEAQRLANQILQKDANHIEGHILMGSVFYAQNEHDKAFAEINHAIELDPKRVDSYLSLARFYIVVNDRTKAEETFRRAISVNNNSGLAHTEYGKYLVQQNRLPEAEMEMSKAVEAEPSNRDRRPTHSLALMLAGIVLYFWGFKLLRLMIVPLFLLLLAIPIPAIIFNKIAFPLQLFASRCAVWAMTAFDIPVLRQGNVIELMPLGARETKKLEVVEACSGIRSLMTLVTLAVVFAYFTHPRNDSGDDDQPPTSFVSKIKSSLTPLKKFSFWRSTIIVLSAVPIAIFTNALRVSGTGILARYYGTRVADGFFHSFSGWVIYVVAFLLLFAVGWLLDRVQRTKPEAPDSAPRFQNTAQLAGAEATE